MRNRRRRLTPLAVIVELHLVFLSFKVFCLYVCVCVCVYACMCTVVLLCMCAYLCVSSLLRSSPLHSYSLAFWLFYSIFLSFHFSARTYTRSNVWPVSDSPKDAVHLDSRPIFLRQTRPAERKRRLRRDAYLNAAIWRLPRELHRRRVGNHGEDSSRNGEDPRGFEGDFRRYKRKSVDDDLPSTVRDDFSALQGTGISILRI